MRRMLWAGLLALPLLLTSTETASAQRCNTGCGQHSPGGAYGNPHGNPFGCGFLCFRMFAGLHQEGPLVNYGPYSGYYPFEPYGPWTSDLRYTGGNGCSQCGLFGRRGCGQHSGCGWSGLNLFGRLHRERDCGACGGGLAMFRNVFARLHPGCRTSYVPATAGCSTGCITER